MIRVIENGDYYNIQVRKNKDENVLEVYQGEKAIGVISNTGAKQLIKVLQEFVDEEYN